MKLKTLLGTMLSDEPIFLHFYSSDAKTFLFAKQYTWEECFRDFDHLTVLTIFPGDIGYNIEVCKKEKTK